MSHVIRWAKETETKTVDWLWKPFIPYGKVTIIEGDGGEGKTTAILAVAAMLSQGVQPPALVNGHLLEEQRVEPITIFYASNEDEIADSTIPRFLRNGGDINRFAYSGELEHHITLNEEEVTAIISETKARLFIIDPFQSFLPSGTHMGNVSKMRAIFTMLSNVARILAALSSSLVISTKMKPARISTEDSDLPTSQPLFVQSYWSGWTRTTGRDGIFEQSRVTSMRQTIRRWHWCWMRIVFSPLRSAMNWKQRNALSRRSLSGHHRFLGICWRMGRCR